MSVNLVLHSSFVYFTKFRENTYWSVIAFVIFIILCHIYHPWQCVIEVILYKVWDQIFILVNYFNILSQTLFIFTTLSTHFSAKKIPTPLKALSFFIQNSLFSADVYTNHSNFPLHSRCLMTYVSTFLKFLLTYLWESLNLLSKLLNLQTEFLVDLVNRWRSN